MEKFVKLPTLAEAVGILIVVATGFFLWHTIVPASVRAKLPGGVK